jgi:hypothetical protein
MEEAPPTGGNAGMRVNASGEFEMEATRGHKLDLDYGPGREIETFRPPEPKSKKEKEKETPSREVVEIGRIQLAKGESTSEPEDKLKVEEQKAAARARLRREVASAVFNVACACLVLYSGIVAIAWLRTPRPIGFDDLGFPMVWLALGTDSKDPGDQLQAAQIKSGIYPTRGGGELFYVEGVALNRSAARHEALYAQVEIRRGDRMLQRADALAQVRASPEHLWALDSRKNEDLQKTLAEGAGSLAVESHKGAPFIAVFKLTAKDVEGCDVRVTVHHGIPASLSSVIAPLPKETTPDTDAPAPDDAAPVADTQAPNP